MTGIHKVKTWFATKNRKRNIWVQKENIFVLTYIEIIIEEKTTCLQIEWFSLDLKDLCKTFFFYYINYLKRIDLKFFFFNLLVRLRYYRIYISLLYYVHATLPRINVNFVLSIKYFKILLIPKLILRLFF